MDTLEILGQLIDTGADGAIIVGMWFFYKLDKRVGELETMLKNGISGRINRMEERLDHHIDTDAS